MNELMAAWVGVAGALGGAVVGSIASGGVAWWLERKRLKLQTEQTRRRLASAISAELEVLSTGVELCSRERDALVMMTIIATLRPAVDVFQGNTDKLKTFNKELTREIIEKYATIRYLIDRGDEMDRKLKLFQHEDSRRHLIKDKMREDAGGYISGIENWISSVRELRKKLECMAER